MISRSPSSPLADLCLVSVVSFSDLELGIWDFFGIWDLGPGISVPSWNRLTPEMQTNRVIKPAIRYSEAFKLQVVSELEREGLTAATLTRKYGVRGHGTVIGWVRKYGNGSRGKVIRVETPQEINELKKLKERVKRLETALADANIELALERAYTKIACQRAGIEDVEEFKKKSAGTQRT